MKRILIFSHNYFPWIAGAEVAIDEITQRLSGFEFELITAWRDKSLPRTEIINNVKIYRIGIGRFQVDQYLYPFLVPLKALNLYKRKKFDAVWAMMLSQAGLGALFFSWLKPQVPYLLSDQSGDSDKFWRRRTWFWQPIFNQIYLRAKEVQVISHFLKRRAEKSGYKRTIYVIPNGVDMDKFAGNISTKDLDWLRKNLNIKQDEKVLISTSRFVYKNAVDIIIKAFADSFINNQCKLLLIGWGDEEQTLKNLTAELGLKEKIIFLKSMPNSELPKYLALADVFIRPSRSEGQGISFIEAMAAGVPVIATPVGGIVDFLEDRKTGLFCRVDDPKGLAENIKLLLNNEKLSQELIYNARKLVREKYDWNNLVHDMNKIFLSLTNY